MNGKDGEAKALDSGSGDVGVEARAFCDRGEDEGRNQRRRANGISRSEGERRMGREFFLGGNIFIILLENNMK